MFLIRSYPAVDRQASVVVRCDDLKPLRADGRPNDRETSQRVLHGLVLGIAAVTSTSRSMPPASSPSRTQSNACHQSS